MPAAFDPYRAQHAYLWHNRLVRWRANPGETTFHGVALLALAAALLWPLQGAVSHLDPGPLHNALQRWPIPGAIALFAVMLLRHVQLLEHLHRKRASDWLGHQPIEPALHATRSRRRQTLEAALQITLAATVFAIADAGWWWFALTLVIASSAALLAPRLARQSNTRITHNLRPRSAIVDAGCGRLWRWQKIETGIAFRGRSLAGGASMLLLVPMGSGLLVASACLVTGLMLAWLLTAWNRSLAVLPAAQAWLGAQPLRAAQLLRHAAGVPTVILSMAVAMLILGFTALAALRFGASAALGVAALGVLHFLSVAAERKRPRRIALVLAVNVALLIGVLQAMPIATPLLWLAQCVLLLRRARAA